MDLERELLQLESLIELEEKELEELREQKRLNQELLIWHSERLHMEQLCFLKLKHGVYSCLLEEEKKRQRREKFRKVWRRIEKFFQKRG